MIDFIEYVVSELKSKRLSKTNAAALVRQFSHRSSSSVAASVIHPLLHRNTSDLSEQRYSSTFTGEEFFLADHQVKADGGTGQKVLPGVAYLEMARAAIEQALPERPESTVLELHNTVWAQPVIVSRVSESKQVSIALLANEHQQIDYEVYSEDADQEIVHCQGRVVLSREPAPARLDHHHPSRVQPGIGAAPAAEDRRRHAWRLCPSSELDGQRPAGGCWVDRRFVRAFQRATFALCAGIVAHCIGLYPGDGRLGTLLAWQPGG